MIGLLAAGLIVTIGTFWAFDRGAPDFTVFYSAWKFVLDGHGQNIYRVAADRFLYAPGFAWLLAPLAWLPRSAALALWCFAKAATVGYVVREFQPLRRSRAGVASAPDGLDLRALGLAAAGTVLLARPLLIDFQYGQVNTLILGAACWALIGHFRADRTESGAWDFVRWFVLACAALAKLFPLPLLLLPWIARAGVAPAKLRRERAGLGAGLAVTLLIPLVSLAPAQAWALMDGWREALVSRGLPFESHNQSFSALLHRWFSGAPVHVVALGMNPVRMGWAWLNETELRLLSLAWISIAAGALLAWLMRAERVAPLRWVAVMLGLLVLPGHLVWKPYFVMFLPVGALVAARRDRTPAGWGLLACAFAAMNLAGFDLLGAEWGARLESASLMLWSSLAYLALA